MTIRVVQRLGGHDRYEAIFDDQLRMFLDVHALAQQVSNGSTVVWDHVRKPHNFDLEVAQTSKAS